MKKELNVAEYISQQIAICGKTQVEIAKTAGFAKPNMISMIKTGGTPLSPARVQGLAEALGIDPKALMLRCLREYQPELLAVLGSTMGVILTENEMALINLLREQIGEVPRIDEDITQEVINIVKRGQPSEAVA